MAGTTAGRGGDRAGGPGESRDVERAAERRLNVSGWNFLLLIPFIGVLVPAFYNKVDPTWGSMPFFYWYQLLWIPISVVLTVIVYKMTKGER